MHATPSTSTPVTVHAVGSRLWLLPSTPEGRRLGAEVRPRVPRVVSVLAFVLSGLLVLGLSVAVMFWVAAWVVQVFGGQGPAGSVVHSAVVLLGAVVLSLCVFALLIKAFLIAVERVTGAGVARRQARLTASPLAVEVPAHLWKSAVASYAAYPHEDDVAQARFASGTLSDVLPWVDAIPALSVLWHGVRAGEDGDELSDAILSRMTAQAAAREAEARAEADRRAAQERSQHDVLLRRVEMGLSEDD